MLTAIIWSDPQVQAAFISMLGSVMGTIIAAIVATMIGRRFSNQKKLQHELSVAHQDIAFLLAVEQIHGEIHQKDGGSSLKRVARSKARDMGHTWSGMFTPGRVARKIAEQGPAQGEIVKLDDFKL